MLSILGSGLDRIAKGARRVLGVEGVPCCSVGRVEFEVGGSGKTA